MEYNSSKFSEISQIMLSRLIKILSIFLISGALGIQPSTCGNQDYENESHAYIYTVRGGDALFKETDKPLLVKNGSNEIIRKSGSSGGCACTRIGQVNIKQVFTIISDIFRSFFLSSRDTRDYFAFIGRLRENKSRIASSPPSVQERYLKENFKELLSYWYNTPYDFYGVTDTPQKGKIACGYFVAITLYHLGYNFDYLEIGRQPASKIIKAFCDKNTIRWFSKNKFSKLKNTLRNLEMVSIY